MRTRQKLFLKNRSAPALSETLKSEMQTCKTRWETTSPKSPRNGELQNEIGTKSERDQNEIPISIIWGHYKDTPGFFLLECQMP